MDIYVTGGNSMYGGGGPYIYQVFVDGQVFDTLTSTVWLTNSQTVDIALGYREGLTGVPAI